MCCFSWLMGAFPIARQLVEPKVQSAVTLIYGGARQNSQRPTAAFSFMFCPLCILNKENQVYMSHTL